MKLANSIFCSLPLALTVLVSCNPGGLEHFPPVPNARMQSINSISDPNCDEGSTGKLPGTEGATDLAEIIAGGGCVNECKNNFEILKKPEDRHVGFLAFPIPGYLGVGRCRGHALVTQKFNMLGNFNSGANKENCGPNNMSSVCMNIYRQAIRDITEGNKVTNIPGFKSLVEFSANRNIYPILYNKVIGYSSSYSAGHAYVDQTTGSRPSDVFNELWKRSKNRQMPYVGIRGGEISDHAILISSVKMINDQRVLCVSDPNKRSYNPLAPDNCQNYIYDKGGSMRYVTGSRERSLSKFNLLADEDFRTDKYVTARNEECMQYKDQQGECSLEVDKLFSSSASKQ